MEHLDGRPVSPHTYKNHHCKCDACRKAWADYCRPRVDAWRKAKRRKQDTV